MNTTLLTLAALAIAYALALLAGVLVWRYGGPFARHGRTFTLALATFGVGFLFARLLARRVDPTPTWRGELLPPPRPRPIDPTRQRFADILNDVNATTQELETLDEAAQDPPDPADPDAGSDFARHLARLRDRR